jgi:ubiquinone/menaquinone biosynthesis C-methylase UbiE
MTEQSEHWKGPGGERWGKNEVQIERAIGVFGERLLEQLAPQARERVIDLGCGSGTSTAALAGAVGTKGQVLGLDVCESLLAKAEQRCSKLPQVEWLCADAAEVEITGQYDALFSRFGSMFFDHPDQAFRHLAKSLRPGGEVAMICWQEREQNAWVWEPLQRILPFLPEPPPAFVPRAPGPFAFADPEYIEQQLQAAGLREIEIRECREDMVMGSGGVAGALEFAMQVGPADRLTGELGPEAMAEVHSALTELFEGVVQDNVVCLPGAAWIVSARR